MCIFVQVFHYCTYFVYLNFFLHSLTLTEFAVEADIRVIAPNFNYTVDIFADIPASFGKVLPPNGLKGYAIRAKPQNACTPIEPPPTYGNYTGHWFVLIRRYDCNFIEKVRTAQAANFDAAIIYNVGSNVIGI